MMLRFLFIIAVLFFAETATATLTLVCPLRQFELKYTTTQYLCQKKIYLFLSRSLDLSYRLFLVFHILKNCLQKEKILTDRLNRVVQLDHASKALEKQMDNHNNGVKVLDNQRLKSIKTRLNSYAAQINESSRTLSPQVCICAFKFFPSYHNNPTSRFKLLLTYIFIFPYKRSSTNYC